ncbi:hypothetical protein A2380_01165 [candidate division WWE3 bacterium RIFOXYB1_FULL_43_24]|uniref:ArnT-like N-terminal domain-containing protein n=2 Tax=Katanobacteria TaxID=422282 RepID=A0A0G1AZF5_UNCKA|nr:MAG: hypothetical protein UU92_C0001G0052 [candidate division WWE3 bacterium GW2011_GWA1_42_12]KKS35183.1 MAG: hypothetical protein UU97_C0001G0034 [candidate division WWE3 bacterium GW2011_GWD1_42_14]KKS39466.1 MAG: hypothetical protein UV00_C0001G0034 [candidate division WWE3 bacterium GW2011_GWF1_42_14]KKS40909.1 MAG: hypothetical protein UV03_C0001G0034 [candidate division WWE3 bacterium GW2011_GWE1_42_16]KKS67269.1 MAG: hypothetical protein UV35_C0001G0037 [candidate division WWE3 bacte
MKTRERLIGFIKNKYVAIIFFILVFGLTRFLFLGPDEVNPDGVNWHYRSQQFIVGLKLRDFERTYQHYHPGVTLMWISGVPIEIYKQITGITTYDQHNFLAFNTVAKVSVVFAQLILTFILLYYLTRVFGFKIAYFSVFLFSLEPFFIGNSRLYHMDVLLALFVLIALLISWLNLKEFSYKGAVLAGVFLSLSFLTKSIGIGALFFVLLFSIAYFAHKKDLKGLLKYFFTILGSFILTTFLLFPAMWVRPVYYLTEIFAESERVGIRKGHEQILFGETTQDAGILFYPLVLLIKTTPFLIIGLMLCLIKCTKSVRAILKNVASKYSNPYLYLAVFYLGYFSVMIYPSKKLDRYMLPLYPFLALLAAHGIVRFYSSIKKARLRKIFISIAIFLFTLFYILPAVVDFPYYFTYTSPVVGTAESANRIIAQKPFGIAVPALKDYIVDRYGSEVELGFIDTKPMKAIYSNSKVVDIRINGVSDYELLILGINEEMPEKVLKSRTRFKKDSSLYINGLEYWRIYVKEDK